MSSASLGTTATLLGVMCFSKDCFSRAEWRSAPQYGPWATATGGASGVITAQAVCLTAGGGRETLHSAGLKQDYVHPCTIPVIPYPDNIRRY